MASPQTLHCVLDCSASMAVWHKLYICKSTLWPLLMQPQLISALFSKELQCKLWYWEREVSTTPPKIKKSAALPVLSDWLSEQVLNNLTNADATEDKLRVLLLTDGCGSLPSKGEIASLLNNEVLGPESLQITVIGVGPDQDPFILQDLATNRKVYSLEQIDLALSEVLDGAFTPQTGIEDDLITLELEIADASDLNAYSNDEEDEW